MWWGIGDGLVIGDGPADAITTVLLDLSGERRAAGHPKPSLDQLLGAARELLGAAEVVAVTGDGEEIAAGQPSEDLAAGMREAGAEITRQYVERWDHPPDPRELLETLLFVVLGSADMLLARGGEVDLQAIETRPERAAGGQRAT
jgi:hypothetical protein